jgi:thiosulfate/3-mercaptopyruvate sulfurtransferase
MAYTTLVGAEALAAHLGDPGWKIFDCRCSASDPADGERRYREGHLPGARHADLDRVLAAPPGPGTGRHPLPDRDTFAAWLGAEGVGNDTQVVAYDDAGGAFAARLWWLMRWMGHEAAAVLDGGLQAWQAMGGGLETGAAPAPEPVRFEAGTPRVAAVDTRGVAAIVLGAREGRLVDARNSQRYHGENEPIDPVAGHIPGAGNLPYPGNLDRQGLFLAPEELRQRFGSLSGDPREVVHYCGSGVTACHNFLAMEHAGLHGSRLYPGSWSEWIRDPARPVEKP